jgi:peptidoglycan/xylan/chitin deacetylase (PgdA/CDA1 family)
MMQGAQPCVALTFDDGPDPEVTPKLLSILEEKGVKASFFVVGFRAEAAPDVVLRAFRDGFDVGNHSWHHVELNKLSNAAALSEINDTDALLTRITGQTPVYTRAPFGALTTRIAGLAPRKYVGWSVDTLDWKYEDAARTTRTAVNEAVNGSIILMHDLYAATAAAVPGVIDGLQKRGFRLVTVTELLSGGCGGRAVNLDFGTPDPVVAGVAPKAATTVTTAAASKPVVTVAAPVTLPEIVARKSYRVHDDDDE